MPDLSPPTHLRRARALAALGLLLATAGTVQAQTPAAFAPASVYPTGFQTLPYAVAVADVNNDGRPDIVTATNSNYALGVLLGQAAGGFGTISSYSPGNVSLNNMVVTDVTGDGRPDVVTANSVADNVGLLLGLASGGFAPVATYYSTGTNAGSRPWGVVVADVNADGRPDIVTANYGNSTAGVLLGLAGGGFAPVSTFLTSGYPQNVAIADVNGDGRADIVTTHDNGVVGVLLGQASGGFGAVSTYPTLGGISQESLAVADVNGDGRPDIVTTDSNRNTIKVLPGQATGGFAPVVAYSTGAGSSPRSVAVADVNGDGRPDLVTANTGTATAGVLLGQAGGSFAAVSAYATGSVPGFTVYNVAVKDVNGDGRPDIIAANYGSSTVGMLLNTGTFTPLAATGAATAAGVTLFPNPARDGFAVQLPAAWGGAPVRAELRNALGQVVREQAAALPAGAAFAFATAGLAPGVYVLRVRAGSHALAKRVVLE